MTLYKLVSGYFTVVYGRDLSQIERWKESAPSTSVLTLRFNLKDNPTLDRLTEVESGKIRFDLFTHLSEKDHPIYTAGLAPDFELSVPQRSLSFFNDFQADLPPLTKGNGHNLYPVVFPLGRFQQEIYLPEDVFSGLKTVQLK